MVLQEPASTLIARQARRIVSPMRCDQFSLLKIVIACP
jgi:hypothetical protein